jgi:hypothetical protein
MTTIVTRAGELIVTSHKELIRAHFDSYAPTWHDRLSNHVYAMRYRAVERMLAHQTIGSALDVGCGTGDFAQLFDPAPHPLSGDRHFREHDRGVQASFPAHEFQVSDGDSIDAAGESVDLVLSIGVLSIWPIQSAI